MSKASTNTSGNGGDAAALVTMSAVIELHLIKAISDGPRVGAKFKDEMAAIRRELGASDQLEALLVERIVLSWARLQFVEAHVSVCCDPGTTFVQANHWEDRLTQAQGRFLKAMMALERVRKLRKRSTTMNPAAAAYLKNSMMSDWTAAHGLRNTER
jgi:hypothetical protein